MVPEYEMKGQSTLETLQKIISTGPDRISLLIRHSARHFHENPKMEPFMGLTEKGKKECIKLGSLLSRDNTLKLFSSHFARCIETAYLMDKGYFQKHGKITNNVKLKFELMPFYIKNIEKVTSMLSELSSDTFLRSWFNQEISEDIILSLEETSHTTIQFMKQELKQLHKNELGIFVSHDWNIYPVKEYFFGLKHEKDGAVGYLESIFLYEKDNTFYLTTHQKGPVIL